MRWSGESGAASDTYSQTLPLTHRAEKRCGYEELQKWRTHTFVQFNASVCVRVRGCIYVCVCLTSTLNRTKCLYSFKKKIFFLAFCCICGSFTCLFILLAFFKRACVDPVRMSSHVSLSVVLKSWANFSTSVLDCSQLHMATGSHLTSHGCAPLMRGPGDVQPSYINTPQTQRNMTTGAEKTGLKHTERFRTESDTSEDGLSSSPEPPTKPAYDGTGTGSPPLLELLSDILKKCFCWRLCNKSPMWWKMKDKIFG